MRKSKKKKSDAARIYQRESQLLEKVKILQAGPPTSQETLLQEYLEFGEGSPRRRQR